MRNWTWLHYLFLRIHYEFAMKSLWNHYETLWNTIYEFTICFANSLSVSRIHLGSTILFAKSLWIHYLFHELSMNFLSAPRFLFESTFFFANSLSFTRIHLESFLLPRSRDKFTIFFAISLWIHYLFRQLTKNLLWIYYLLRDFTKNLSSFSRILYLFREFFMNSLSSLNSHSFSRIHYLFREFTLNSLSFLRNHDEFINRFILSLWIKYLLRDFTMNRLSFSWFHYEFTIYFAISLWIHFFMISLWINYSFRDCTMNSLSISWLHYEFTILFPKSL